MGPTETPREAHHQSRVNDDQRPQHQHHHREKLPVPETVSSRLISSSGAKTSHLQLPIAPNPPPRRNPPFPTRTSATARPPGKRTPRIPSLTFVRCPCACCQRTPCHFVWLVSVSICPLHHDFRLPLRPCLGSDVPEWLLDLDFVRCTSCRQCAPVLCVPVLGFGCPLLPFCPNLLDVDRFDSAPATLTEITTCNLLTDCPVSRPLGHLDERYVRLASPASAAWSLSCSLCPAVSLSFLSSFGWPPVTSRSCLQTEPLPPRPATATAPSVRLPESSCLSTTPLVLLRFRHHLSALANPGSESPSRPILSGDLPGLTGSPSRSPAQRLLGSPVPLAPIPSLASVSRAAVILRVPIWSATRPVLPFIPAILFPCLLPDPSSHVLLLAPSARQPTWLIPQN